VLTLSQRPLTTKRANERREQLLGIALEMFLNRDYDAISVDDVAEIAGVSHGLIFQYFGSKKGLYIAALEPLLAGFRLQTRGAPADLEPAERLRHGIGAYFDAAANHPAAYRSLMSGGAGFREVYDRIEAARWGGIELIASTIGLDIERPDVRVALRGWVGFLDGAVLVSMDRPDVDREALIDATFSVFTASLATLESVD
jgi:AcrR family transcriptional regulator